MIDERLKRYVLLQKALLSSLHLNDVLKASVCQLTELTGGKTAIFLADNDSLSFKLMSYKGYADSSMLPWQTVPFAGQTLLKHVFKKRKGIAIALGQPIPSANEQLMIREQSRAEIALPLAKANLLLGSVLIDLAGANLDPCMDFLQSASDVISGAIANAIVYGQAEQERKSLNALYNASIALSGNALSVRDLLKTAVDSAVIVADTPYCAILLLDGQSKQLQIVAFKGLSSTSLPYFDCSLADSVAGRCFQSKKLEYLPDATGIYGLPHREANQPFGSLICLPMLVGQAVLGVVILLAESIDAFGRQQISLAETLTNQVSQALQNAFNYESVANQSHRDPHTGLYNRWHFEELLAREIERCQRHEHNLSLLLIDIDHLFAVNDHLGQTKGDEAIGHVAQTIKNTLRDIDIPCRWGGEEFAVFMPDTTITTAAQVAGRLTAAIRRNCVPGLGTVTVSIGVSAYPGNGNTAALMITAAHQALNIAKFEGRDRVKVSQAGLPSAAIVSWDELAEKAKAAILSERQAKQNKKLAMAKVYVNWMRANS